MKKFKFSKAISLSLAFFTICYGEHSFSEVVTQSIIPNVQNLKSNNTYSAQITKRKELITGSVINSLRPKSRYADVVKSDNLIEKVFVNRNRPRNKKETRNYIMGHTVPIFRSVVPLTRAL